MKKGAAPRPLQRSCNLVPSTRGYSDRGSRYSPFRITTPPNLHGERRMQRTQAVLGCGTFCCALAQLLLWSGGRLASQESTQGPTASERIQQGAAEAPLALRFQGDTAEACRKWQVAFATQLRSLLGPHAPPKQWKTVRVRADDLDDHRREELLLLA